MWPAKGWARPCSWRISRPPSGLSWRRPPDPPHFARSSTRRCALLPSSGKFVTFFYGVIDCEQMTLQYENAGHLPPLLLRNGSSSKLTEGGTVLGLFANAEYHDRVVALQPGDCLISRLTASPKRPMPVTTSLGRAGLWPPLWGHYQKVCTRFVSKFLKKSPPSARATSTTTPLLWQSSSSLKFKMGVRESSVSALLAAFRLALLSGVILPAL